MIIKAVRGVRCSVIVILAISAAFFWALDNVIIRIGLTHSNTRVAVLIAQLSAFIASLSVAIFTASLDRLAGRGVLYFIGAGIMGSFLARILLYVGIHRVGSSIAAALNQTRPLFAAAAAIVILSETMTTSIALATSLMIIGTATISLEQSGGQIERKWSRKNLVFPLMSGVCFGTAHVFRKMGLNVTPEPILGVMVQNAAGLILIVSSCLVQRQRQWVGLTRGKTWFTFGLAGLSGFTAQLCLFSALDVGHVVIVTPLVSLEPFFVLLLAGLFLKKVERVTWKIVFGAVLIVGGATMLSLT